MDLRYKYVVATNLQECIEITSKARRLGFDFCYPSLQSAKRNIDKNNVYFLFTSRNILHSEILKIALTGYQKIEISELFQIQDLYIVDVKTPQEVVDSLASVSNIRWIAMDAFARWRTFVNRPNLKATEWEDNTNESIYLGREGRIFQIIQPEDWTKSLTEADILSYIF